MKICHTYPDSVWSFNDWKSEGFLKQKFLEDYHDIKDYDKHDSTQIYFLQQLPTTIYYKALTFDHSN